MLEMQFSTRFDPITGTHQVLKTHHWKDLPMKGLGKSMKDVKMFEPVIIPSSVGLAELICWGYTVAEIERRAYELEAEVIRMEIPNTNLSAGNDVKMWFSPQLQKKCP